MFFDFAVRVFTSGFKYFVVRGTNTETGGRDDREGASLGEGESLNIHLHGDLIFVLQTPTLPSKAILQSPACW